MGKKRSGPDGPDHTAEPDEIGRSNAALNHVSAAGDFVQPQLDASLAGCDGQPCEVELGAVVYDSGWEDRSGIEVRVVFTAGPPNGYLQDWARRMSLRPQALPGSQPVDD